MYSCHKLCQLYFSTLSPTTGGVTFESSLANALGTQALVLSSEGSEGLPSVSTFPANQGGPELLDQFQTTDGKKNQANARDLAD